MLIDMLLFEQLMHLLWQKLVYQVANQITLDAYLVHV